MEEERRLATTTVHHSSNTAVLHLTMDNLGHTIKDQDMVVRLDLTSNNLCTTDLNQAILHHKDTMPMTEATTQEEALVPEYVLVCWEHVLV